MQLAMGECRMQSCNWLQMPVSKLHCQYLFHIFSDVLQCQDFLFLTVSSYLSAVACYEEFPLIRCTLDEFVFIFYGLVYKLTTKRSNVVFLLKKLLAAIRRYLILIGFIHLASPIWYLIQGATEQSPTLSFLIRKETILRKSIFYALMQDDEFASLAKFKGSYLTCVVIFFCMANLIGV